MRQVSPAFHIKFLPPQNQAMEAFLAVRTILTNDLPAQKLTLEYLNALIGLSPPPRRLDAKAPTGHETGSQALSVSDMLFESSQNV